MRTLLFILFTLAWGALAFAVIRALVVAFGLHRRLAGATALAVAGAFVLGSLSPFSLGRNEAPASPIAQPPVATHPIACPAQPTMGGSPSTAAGHIDTVSVGDRAANPAALISVAPNQPLRLGGWVAAKDAPASGMCVLVDGKPVAFEGTYGFARPDVANALANPADRATGFDAIVRAIPRGAHVVTVAPVGPDGKLTPVDQTLKVVVR